MYEGDQEEAIAKAAGNLCTLANRSNQANKGRSDKGCEGGECFRHPTKKNSLSKLFSVDFSWRFSFYVHQKVQNEMNKFCRLLLEPE